MNSINLDDYSELAELVHIYCAGRLLLLGISVMKSVIMSGKTGSMSLTSPPMIAGSTPAPDTKAAECT